MKKLVSVIIPTHGGGEHLNQTITSVFEQDYPNLEIIVVDDNGKGTPNQLKTNRVIEPFLKNEKFSYIVHEINSNGAVARNTGFKSSKGDYIAFLDDDDIYLPSKISSQVEVMEQRDDNWGMAFCSYIKYAYAIRLLRPTRPRN